MSILVRILVNALALGAAAWLLDGIEVSGATTSDRAVTLLVVGAVFGLVNAVIAPVVKLLSLPFIIVTLGLMLLVINALMLLLTTRIAEAFDLGFSVDGFWTAVLGAIIISIVSGVLSAVADDD